MKCKKCRFAIGHKFWIPAKEDSPLQKAQFEAYEKRGIVCSGNLRAIIGEELEKDVESCDIYRKGVLMFGG